MNTFMLEINNLASNVITAIKHVWDLSFIYFTKDVFFEWFKLIVTTAIGGAIGGWIAYFYVIHNENKKEKREERNRCAKVLLKTQMEVLFQMDELYGLNELCKSILNMKVS